MMDASIRPQPDHDADGYYAGLRQGKLMLKHCRDCDRPHFYPRELCPHCHSDALEWRESKGTGEVYSYTIVRRPPPIMKGREPYAVALVELDEGPRMMAPIAGCEPGAVFIGQRMRIGFNQADEELVLPTFSPIED
jgi:uncharacterized OB-fold protein